MKERIHSSLWGAKNSSENTKPIVGDLATIKQKEKTNFWLNWTKANHLVCQKWVIWCACSAIFTFLHNALTIRMRPFQSWHGFEFSKANAKNLKQWWKLGCDAKVNRPFHWKTFERLIWCVCSAIFTFLNDALTIRKPPFQSWHGFEFSIENAKNTKEWWKLGCDEKVYGPFHWKTFERLIDAVQNMILGWKLTILVIGVDWQ